MCGRSDVREVWCAGGLVCGRSGVREVWCAGGLVCGRSGIRPPAMAKWHSISFNWATDKVFPLCNLILSHEHMF